jgi:hypothetical protein
MERAGTRLADRSHVHAYIVVATIVKAFLLAESPSQMV